MPEFIKIDFQTLEINVFTKLDKEWMLITAGDQSSFNTMTASWGGFGILWHKNVCFCFIRPTRHTFQFIEKYRHFTLSFFPEKYRDALNICGSKSGRDSNKVAEAKLSPQRDESGSIYFKEANLVFSCEKIYYQDLLPQHFLAPDINTHYPLKDFHRMYVGEIKSILKKK